MKISWPKKLSFRRVLLILFGLAVAGSIVYGFLPRPVAVDMAQVSRGLLQVTVDEDGKTRIKERYIISAPINGLLQRITLHPGDEVRIDKSLLATIEPNIPTLLDPKEKIQAEAKVKAAKAAKNQVQAKLSQAQKNYFFADSEVKRQQKLLVKDAVSLKELEDAERQVYVTREEVKSAQFAILIADYEVEIAEAVLKTVEAYTGNSPVDRFHILSPITGKVLKVFQEDAAAITAGKQLLEVGDPRDLEVEVDVLSSDGVKIKPGARVYLEHWGGDHVLNGLVRLVEPAAFLKISALGVEEQRVNVIIDLLDPPEKRKTLGDAYRVEARIVIWEGKDVLKIPAGALFRHNESWAVFRVINGQAQLQLVRVGKSNGLETEILEGLSEEDVVVVHPSDKVKTGVLVVPR